ncbi:MAG: metal ABC transporter substrate-binding protein [Candidatus Odinarchaeota archaeon]
MRRNSLLALIGIFALSLSTIGILQSTSSQTTPALEIAVSIQSLAGIVREVGGEEAEISVLLPEGVEPHAFSLTQAVIDAANAADMLVLTGHFEWEEELATFVGKPYITIADYEAFGAELLPLNGHDQNLHGYWLSPKNAKAIANATRDLCSSLNSTYSQYWQNRFDEFVFKVKALEAFIAEQQLQYQLSNKQVIITFPAEAYIADALGLQVKGLLMKGENIFISGPELVVVEQALRNGSIHIILASDVARLQAAGDFAQQLSSDSGVPIVWVRIVFSDLEDYVGIMGYNTGVVVTGVSSGILPASDLLTISMPVIIIATVLGVIAIIELVLLIRCTRSED